MFGRVLNTLLISVECKYNIKFSKKDQNTTKAKKTEKKNEFDERCAGLQVGISSLYIIDKEQKQQPATFLHETLALVFK